MVIKSNKKKRKIKKIPILLIIIFILMWSIFIYKFSPNQVIEILGVKNSYLLVFFTALIGGTSLFLPIPYYLLVFTLGASKLNPIIIGIFAGTGVILGESTSYLVGYAGKEVIHPKLSKVFNKLYHWCNNKPQWLMSLALFLYGALIPFPNDFITVSMGLARYPFWKMIIPLGLGNIVFNIIIATLGFYGLNFIF